MPRFRYAAVPPLFVAAYVAWGVAGCDTKAIAVDDCRDLEKARCVAARSCDLGVDSDKDEEVCQRFARDNCLHGLSTGVTPKRGQVDSCLRVIRGAGACAADLGGDTNATECADIGQTQSSLSVCAVVEDPTQAYDCAWLLDDPPVPPEPTVEDAGTD